MAKDVPQKIGDDTIRALLAEEKGHMGYNSLWDGRYSDIVLKISDPEPNDVITFKSHKCILSDASPVWEAAIRWNKYDVLKLNDFPIDIIGYLLYFIYNGKIMFKSIDSCLEIIEAADYYNISSIMKHCEEYLLKKFLCTSIDVKQYVKIFNWASSFNISRITEYCLGYLEDNAYAFIPSYEFTNLNSSSISIILNFEKYLCPRCIFVKSILNWTDKNIPDNQLSEYLIRSETVDLIRFHYIPLHSKIQFFRDYPKIFQGSEKENIQKYSMQTLINGQSRANELIKLNKLSKYLALPLVERSPRWKGNCDIDEAIIVGLPPMMVSFFVNYAGGPYSMLISSIEISPRINLFMPSCKTKFEESVTIEILDQTINYNGISSRITGNLIKCEPPIRIDLKRRMSFQIVICLNRCGEYNKSIFTSTCTKGLMAVQKGIIRKINHTRIE